MFLTLCKMIHLYLVIRYSPEFLVSDNSSGHGAASASQTDIPKVVIPGDDIFIPGIGIPVEEREVPKQLGQPCGSCNCPPSFTAGQCDQGLECVHNPMVADAPGTCMEPGKKSGYKKRY